MEEKIKYILKEKYPEIDFESGEDLVDEGILDSLILTGILSEIAVEFDVMLPFEEIVPENFNSIVAMAALVEKYI